MSNSITHYIYISQYMLLSNAQKIIYFDKRFIKMIQEFV